MSNQFMRQLVSVASLALSAVVMLWPHTSVHGAPPAAASTAEVRLDPPVWNELTPRQRQVLQPLGGLWQSMDDTSKDKWVNVATRFDKLSPAEQQRVKERMTQWSRLPAQQRGEARLRFQQTRKLPPEERQKKWAAYQALSPEDRQALAQQAQRKQKPVLLPSDMAGPREQAQQLQSKQRVSGKQDRKSNEVPNALHSSPPPTAVAPSLIKAGPGATTSLVNQQPAPPLHQQAGLPKINASQDFVDPVTLLPRKGAQGAAVTAVMPAPSPASR